MSENEEILDKLNSRVYGHTHFKKLLINLVNRSRLRYVQKWFYLYAPDRLIKTMNCTGIGQSGTGKTATVEALSDIMGFPYLKIDATQLTHTSATGLTQEKAWTMIEEKAKEVIYYDGGKKYFSIEGVKDQLIIVIDEVDKLAGSKWQEDTQANFLTMFDKYGDSSGLSFVFLGAFSGMNYTTNTHKAPMGFNIQNNSTSSEQDLTNEMIKYGLKPELVGRMGMVSLLDELTIEDYRSIFLSTILPEKQMTLYDMGITNFDVPNTTIDDIIERAMKSGVGVRYMQQAIDNLAMEAEFTGYEAPNHAPKSELKSISYSRSADITSGEDIGLTE